MYNFIKILDFINCARYSRSKKLTKDIDRKILLNAEESNNILWLIKINLVINYSI